ncbi:MAG: hypothetical protein JWL93_2861 [Hyphomicrobiales bacterium]|nr:hypothetical protein [Hyphomicrobiales bacterium]
MSRIKKISALAFVGGLMAAGLAFTAAPVQAQQRGTGVVEGGGGGGGGGFSGGGGGFSRGAVAAQRYGAPAGGGGGMRYGGGPSMQQRAVGVQRYGAGYPNAGARTLTVSPGARYERRQEYVRRYGDRGDWNGRRWRGRGWYGPGIGLATAPLWLGGYGPYYDQPYYDWGNGYDEGYDYPVEETYVPAPVPVYPAPRRYSAALGNHCSTPQKVCQLYQPAQVGIGCSCRAPSGGRFRGQVVP